MKTCKKLIATMIAASLLLSGSAFAGYVSDKANTYWFEYFKTQQPKTLAGTIYRAMKENPVAAEAAYRSYMIKYAAR